MSSDRVLYSITPADVAEATEIAVAALQGSSGVRPLIVSMGAVMLLEVARVLGVADRSEGDALYSTILKSFREKFTDSDLEAFLRDVGAKAVTTTRGGVA